ncbi:hypothetical protein Q7P37_001359 [Cladosporium fusiforme]
MDSMDGNFSDSSSSPPAETIHVHSQASKRTASDAGLKSNGTRPPKSVKRRASKACQCCRSRKVRCNVVEHGAPCTNCRLDEVECIVSESKRKKKWTTNETSPAAKNNTLKPAANVPMSAHPPYEPLRRSSEHVPHSLYQDLKKDVLANSTPRHSISTPSILYNLQRLGQQRNGSISETMPMLNSLVSPTATPPPMLPAYIKPLPDRLGNDEITYLQNKGALSIPNIELRNELIRCYAEVIHPFMPLLDLHDFVATVDCHDGSKQMGILLFQSVMFAGIASVDMRHLKNAGYSSRRDARRDFFNKTRLLYDFDLEADRIPLIQSLLIMTYWYETPDDQKDSHHWMGIAVSLAQTIGLHRNPEKMDPARRKLWKRIWWSTYMRDRLIALGMRRPTRIKTGDFDVPMLTVDDFEIAALPEESSCIPSDCTLFYDVEKQRQLAVLCIEKAKLCICISSVLSVQYSVLHNNQGVANAEGSTRTTMTLQPKRNESGTTEVQSCDEALQEWKANLPEEALYRVPMWNDVESGDGYMVLNRSLLHMIYFSTLSALHRPQVLPSSGMVPRDAKADVIDVSRKAVRLAASEITSIASTLYNLDLVRLLPTTGITVLLPAVIIHLLDIKAPDEATRRTSLQGFCQCMQTMARLRDIYAAADYSTAFLEAAIRKAEITLPQKPNEVKEPRNVITSTQGLMDAGRRMKLTNPPPPTSNRGHLTPPPENQFAQSNPSNVAPNGLPLTDDDIARRLNSYLASTPPDSDHHGSGASDHHFPTTGSEIDPLCAQTFPESMDSAHHSMAAGADGKFASLDDHSAEQINNMFADGAIMVGTGDLEPDFDSMINLDALGGFADLADEHSYGVMQGESSGFALDWMQGMGSGNVPDGLGSDGTVNMESLMA